MRDDLARVPGQRDHTKRTVYPRATRIQQAFQREFHLVCHLYVRYTLPLMLDVQNTTELSSQRRPLSSVVMCTSS